MLGFIGVTACLMGFAVIKADRKTVTVEAVGNRAPLLSEVIEEVRSELGVPRGAIETLIWIESRFKEDAKNEEKESNCYRKAKTKAEKETCASFGLVGAVSRWLPVSERVSLIYYEANVRTLSRGSFARAWRKTHNLEKAFAAHNGSGPKAVRYGALAMAEWKTYWRSRT